MADTEREAQGGLRVDDGPKRPGLCFPHLIFM